jgi:hypothetical protein
VDKHDEKADIESWEMTSLNRIGALGAAMDERTSSALILTKTLPL